MLSGKNIIVTGGTRGLGEGIVLKCLSLGARVGIVYLNSHNRAENIRNQFGSQVMLLKADVRDEIAVNARFKEFVSTTGALDGLVNNAGVATLGLLALSRDSAPLRAMIDTNLLATILCSRAALTIMYRQRHGAIVNMGSVAGIRPSTGQAVYAATKGGVLAFSNALAVECGQAGIRVNCLSPGGVRTDMLAATVGTDIEKLVRRSPLGSLASIEDIAASVAFLLSSDAASITGAHLTVDAGYSTGFLSENS